MSAAIVGAAVGSALGGLLSDSIGRKLALLAGDGLFTAGALCMATATSAAVLISGKPIYMSTEIAQLVRIHYIKQKQAAI